MNTSQHDDDKTDDNPTADDPSNDNTPETQHSTESGHLWWQGALAGALAGGVALMFGQFVEALSDTIPGLVLGMGEWILDITPAGQPRRASKISGPLERHRCCLVSPSLPC